MRNSFIHSISLCLTAVALVAVFSCSTTSELKEGEQLYTGMKPTVYENYEKGEHFISTKAEIEAALACAPNGAFFGSSYYRNPFQYALWVYNAFYNKKGAIAKWMTQTIGKAPVLMTDANPELHVSVGKNVLQNNGYFQGDIDYKIIEGKKGTTKTDSIPRVLSNKIAYTVNLGPLYKLDSIEYKGFTDNELSLIHSTPSVLKKNDPFCVADLDEERLRIYNLFKDNGYYFFEENYITYLADTLQVPEHVQLQICKVDSLPEDAMKQWKVGKTTFQIKRQMMEQITDSLTRRSLIVKYAGKKSPIRARVILQDIKLRPKQMFSQSNLKESMTRLTTKGIFSSTDISFTKSPSMAETDTLGTLDMLVDCTLDKPYDFALSAGYTQKSSGRGGPGVSASFAKRNAFRGGEILSLTLKGNIEFQLGSKGQDKALNYDLGGDLSLSMPRVLLPTWMKPRRRWYYPPSTMFTISMETINRSGYFRRNIFSGNLTYSFQPTQFSSHTIIPLSIAYTRLSYHTTKYDTLQAKSGYTAMTLFDYIIPKMKYTYSYSSKAKHLNPITTSVSVEEAGAISNAIMSIGGRSWNEKDKKILNAPVVQFVKVEADFVKTWRMDSYSKLLAHIFAGYIHSYGNSDDLPFSESYYVGGANDLRGFSTRAVGPGSLHMDKPDVMYFLSHGNFKLTGNLEYRPRLFGSLYGALFMDAGNVWNSVYKNTSPEYSLQFSHFLKDIAVSAGVGIRYDLDFFVLRLDWGFIVHAPYDTGRSGYFNFPSFKKGQCLNFAIGYPF